MTKYYIEKSKNSKYKLSDFIECDKVILKDNDLIVLQKDYFGNYRTCDGGKCDQLKKQLNLQNDLIVCCYFCEFKFDCADCCELDNSDDGFFFDDKDDIVRCSYERFFETNEIEK